MVSAGTVITLGIIGAVGAAAVGLYAARNQIGGALSRGIEEGISNPFRNYFENLFRGSTNGGGSAGGNTEAENQKLYEELQKENQALRDQEQQQYQEQYGQEVKTPDQVLNLLEKYFGPAPGKVAPPLPKDFPGEEHRDANPEQPKNEPLFAPSPAGYYYFDFAGKKYDFQAKLTESEADLYRSTDVGGSSFKQLIYLGLSKISPEGLESFGQAKNLYI